MSFFVIIVYNRIYPLYYFPVLSRSSSTVGFRLDYFFTGDPRGGVSRDGTPDYHERRKGRAGTVRKNVHTPFSEPRE